VAIPVGGSGSTWDETGGGWPAPAAALAAFAAVALLVTGRYPRDGMQRPPPDITR
jgi:hypothetical protein